MAETKVTGRQINGDWQDWTPTFSGITVGNGSYTARYTQVGKTVYFYLVFAMGSTSSMGNGIFTLPVTASSNYPVTQFDVGTARYLDSGTAQYIGRARLQSTTEVRPLINNVGGTYGNDSGLSTTAPFTWTTSDGLRVEGMYEAA